MLFKHGSDFGNYVGENKSNNTKRRDKESGQASLFDLMSGGGASQSTSNETYADVGEWPIQEKLQNEREAVGFYLSGHPLDRYIEDSKKLGAIRTVELTQMRRRQRHRRAPFA